jgi:hypothetical protein
MEGLNTLDPKVATRWIEEYERADRDEKSAAGRHRQERREFKDRKSSIADRAEASGINRKAFLDETYEREVLRKIEARKAGDNQEQKEQRELLKEALGGLPLGDWGVENLVPQGRPRKNAAAPGTEPVGMTLAEAKEILAKPKGRGRPSAQRIEAERVVAEADRDVAVDAGLRPGVGGAEAEALAEAMGPDEGGQDALSSLVDDRGDNIEDLRPRWARSESTPPEAA